MVDVCTCMKDLSSDVWTNVSIRLSWHKMEYYKKIQVINGNYILKNLKYNTSE